MAHEFRVKIDGGGDEVPDISDERYEELRAVFEEITTSLDGKPNGLMVKALAALDVDDTEYAVMLIMLANHTAALRQAREFEETLGRMLGRFTLPATVN